MRASDADREQVADGLKTAYVEGRLAKDEYDARLGSTFAARTYADLDAVMSDLPRPHPIVVPPVPTALVTRTNGMAIASLVCALAQFAVGPLMTIPAIVLGHLARSQIRRTGEQGAGLALAGLALGWGVAILCLLVALVAALVVAVAFHGPGYPHLAGLSADNRKGRGGGRRCPPRPRG